MSVIYKIIIKTINLLFLDFKKYFFEISFYLCRNVTKRQVAEKRVLAITYVHVCCQVVGNPRQVVVIEHDAFRIARRSRL